MSVQRRVEAKPRFGSGLTADVVDSERRSGAVRRLRGSRRARVCRTQSTVDDVPRSRLHRRARHDGSGRAARNTDTDNGAGRAEFRTLGTARDPLVAGPTMIKMARACADTEFDPSCITSSIRVPPAADA